MSRVRRGQQGAPNKAQPIVGHDTDMRVEYGSSVLRVAIPYMEREKMSRESLTPSFYTRKGGGGASPHKSREREES